MSKRHLVVALGLLGLMAGLAIFSAQISRASQSNPWKGEYFQNRTLSGTPAFKRDDPVITFEWGYGPPVEGWTISENYSARWTITEDFGTGNYTFAARSDDGVRMYVDSQIVIDAWHDQESGDWIVISKTMTAGKHTVKVEYYQHNGWAAIQAGYYPEKPPTAVVVTAGPSPTKAPATIAPTVAPTRTPSLFGTISSKPTSQVQPPQGFTGGGNAPGAGGTPNPNDRLIEFNVDKLVTWEGFPGPALHTGGQAGLFGYIKNRSTKPTFHVQWTIAVPQSGYYDLYIFVPAGQNMTKSATYRLFNNGTLSPGYAVDQSSNPDQWVYLGSFYLTAGPQSDQYLYLDNVTTEESGTRNIVLDALRLVFKP